MTYLYCNESVELIENYKEALEDKNEIWDCHHKLEIHEDYRNSIEDLKLMNLYYNRPASELILLKRIEHHTLHKGHTKKTNKNYFGNTNNPNSGKPLSDFGKKFYEYYGKTKRDDKHLYEFERTYCRRHNKTCRWEV